MHWLRAVGILGAGLAVFGAVACGGDDDDDDGGDTADVGTASAVKVTQDSKHGAILTSATGLTLYTFTQDSSGKSTCSGACAEAWPPVEAAAAPAVEGAKGDFSIITRDDGKKQVAFNGRPLYRFAADKAAGDATGEGQGGVWFVAKADGSAPAASGAPAGGSSPVSSGGENPYSY